MCDYRFFLGELQAAFRQNCLLYTSQHPNDQRGYNCSHSIIQALIGQHPFELSACHANTLEHSKLDVYKRQICTFVVSLCQPDGVEIVIFTFGFTYSHKL